MSRYRVITSFKQKRVRSNNNLAIKHELYLHRQIVSCLYRIERRNAIMTQIEGSRRRKLRVLIADDIQETRRNTRLMLATIDDVEVVAIASNGVQAVDLSKEHHPDIVLLDINMPEMDGLSAYRRIAQIHPDRKSVV